MSMDQYKQMVMYLRSYREKELEVEDYETKMYGIKGISYSQEEKGATFTEHNPMNFYIQKVIDLQKELLEIQMLVDKLDGMEKIVIFNKFIRGIKLEDIADEKGYSLVQISRYYRNAILNLIKLKDDM